MAAVWSICRRAHCGVETSGVMMDECGRNAQVLQFHETKSCFLSLAQLSGVLNSSPGLWKAVANSSLYKIELFPSWMYTFFPSSLPHRVDQRVYWRSIWIYLLMNRGNDLINLIHVITWDEDNVYVRPQANGFNRPFQNPFIARQMHSKGIAK